MRRTDRALLWYAFLLGLLAGAGCSSGDERLVELSRESLDRQAEQNTEMARQNQEIARATRGLVETDSRARQEILELHRDIQAERAGLDRQHEELDDERQELARERHRDPIIANAIAAAALLLAACLPLVLCVYLVRALDRGDDDETVGALLISELASECPVLLPPPGEPTPGVDDPLPRPTPAIPARPLAGEDSTGFPDAPSGRPGPLLVMLEGMHDAQFLKRISARLCVDDSSLPDLQTLVQNGQVIFIPTGGSSLGSWTHRLGGLGHAELHLYDREIPPVTEERQRIVEAINARPGCRALLTQKRALENYLHPQAVGESLGIEIGFSDDDDVPELAARQLLKQQGGCWDELSRRGRRRLRERAKRRLNTGAVERMTPRRLAERDPQGEIVAWLRLIGRSTRR